MIESTDKRFFTGKFYYKGQALNEGPSYGMTMKAAGSMRFRWNETNLNRNLFLKELCGDNRQSVALELIHSQTVFAVESEHELDGMQGDGIITKNTSLVPVVTVADCMPIFLYDPISEVFGMLHSGWKGTGIIRNAVQLAEKMYGSRPQDFCVVMGPHIHDCCYAVEEERAQYFRVNFTPECIREEKVPFYGNVKEEKKYWLSLAKANLAVMKELGIDEDSIVTYNDCTCCNSSFGSFRRETSGLDPKMGLEERQKHFTVQAAWVGFLEK